MIVPVLLVACAADAPVAATRTDGCPAFPYVNEDVTWSAEVDAGTLTPLAGSEAFDAVWSTDPKRCLEPVFTALEDRRAWVAAHVALSLVDGVDDPSGVDPADPDCHRVGELCVLVRPGETVAYRVLDQAPLIRAWSARRPELERSAAPPKRRR